MTIQGHSKIKTILRSSIVLLLILSILISSISISFAYNEGSLTDPDTLINSTPTLVPQGNQFYGPKVTRDNLDLLYDETCRVALMVHQPYEITDSNGIHTYYQLSTITSYNELIFVPVGNNVTWGIYSRTPNDVINYCSYSFSSGGSLQSYYCGGTATTIPGFSGEWYRCSDNTLLNRFTNLDGDFYCNANFYIYGSDFLVSENLNVTAYLPDPHYFEANFNGQLIYIDVNFDPHVYSSFVTVWGYNEFGSTPYIYSSSEYNFIIDDEVPEVQDTWRFYLDVDAIKSAYVGTDFHIASISCMGWSDAFEKTLSVDWNFSSVVTPGNYNPPNDVSYYYTTFYNETYNYSEQNGNVVSFGNVDICLYSNQTLDRVFWDKQKTLITPYKYSYVFLPVLLIGDSYYRLLDELCLEFDVVICNCPDAVFDAMYGSGAAAEFRNLTTTNSFILWFTTKFRFYDIIPYSFFNNLPDLNYTSYDCTALYTDSFYFKSLSYLFGDNNERLLEFETRILGEDGAFQELLKSLKTMYKNDYDYYTGMLTYMSKVNYIVQQVADFHYFENVLKYLKTLSEKDFTIDLPEFDFTTVLGKYLDSNLSNLTDFISHSVSDLPTWDFSSLSTFTDAIGNLFISVAPDGEFIENISNPYSFGDSVEDDLFTDN